MQAVFFESQSQFRRWLEENHAKTNELWAGFYKDGSELQGITYKQALDEALCFGWIDGLRKSIDDQRWMIRFTPRKRDSIWSAVNLRRVGELTALGLMAAPGVRAFEQRDPKRSQRYSYENRPGKLDEAYEKTFRGNSRAWKFFESQAPSYRKTAIFWVMAAKKEETRLKRLASLMTDSENERRLNLLSPGKRA